MRLNIFTNRRPGIGQKTQKNLMPRWTWGPNHNNCL